MCDLCPAQGSPQEYVDWCSCPLWDPCTCSFEAPVATGYADAHPWRVDTETERRRRAGPCAGSAA
jgi:hypothetical protein